MTLDPSSDHSLLVDPVACKTTRDNHKASHRNWFIGQQSHSIRQGLGFNKCLRIMDMFAYIVTITMLLLEISARVEKLALIFMLLVCLALQQQDQATDKVSITLLYIH